MVHSHFTPKHAVVGDGFLPLTGRRVIVMPAGGAATAAAHRLAGRLKTNLESVLASQSAPAGPSL